MTFAGYIARTTRMRRMCWQVTPWSTRADTACAWWPEPETDDADWRAAAYERAATRPCTDLPTCTLRGRNARVCFNPTAYGKQVRLDAGCGGTP